jgi:hypothetical protein
VSDANLSVFVNCPFDEAYKPLFEAIFFTISSSGYRVRCALEESDAGDMRFEKLCRLISQSARSIHDLSRIELGDHGLPRFNMPFEFGLFVGARKFGGKPHRGKTSLAMIGEKHKLPIYLSDVSGSDPECHHGRPEDVIKIVRRYLAVRPDGRPLPGAARFISEFKQFKAELPSVAARFDITPAEIDPFREYLDYQAFILTFLKRA